MSLILRTNLARPLTHIELDSNFSYLQIIEWVKKNYQQGQYVIRSVGDETKLYFCVKSHTDYLYTINGDTFTETNVEGGETVRYWKQIYTNNGGGSVLIDASLDENFILTLTSSDQSEVTVDLSPLYANGVYTPNVPSGITTPEKVGGIESGVLASDLGGNTFSEMFDLLLFPPINPTLVEPTFDYTKTNNSLYKIGETINLNTTATYNRGSILEPWDSNAFQDHRGGLPVGYAIYYSPTSSVLYIESEEVYEDITTALSISYMDTYTIISGYQTWGAKVLTSNGPQPKNNYGQDTLSPYVGTSITKQFSIEGVYPIYATTVNIATLTEQPLVSHITGNNLEYVLVSETDVSNKHKFELPKLLTDSRPLTAIYYFNTVSNQYDTANKLSEFATQSVINGGVDYLRYTHTGVLAGSRKIKLVF